MPCLSAVKHNGKLASIEVFVCRSIWYTRPLGWFGPRSWRPGSTRLVARGSAPQGAVPSPRTTASRCREPRLSPSSHTSAQRLRPRSLHDAVVHRLSTGDRAHGLRGGPVLDEVSSVHHVTAIRGLSGSSASGEVRVQDCAHTERRFLVPQQDTQMRLHFWHLPVGFARCRHPPTHILARELDVNAVRCDEVTSRHYGPKIAMRVLRKQLALLVVIQPRSFHHVAALATPPSPSRSVQRVSGRPRHPHCAPSTR